VAGIGGSIVAIGRHQGHLDGELLALEVRGMMTAADVRSLQAIVGERLSTQGRCFIIADLKAMTGIDAEGRRSMAQWSKDHADPVSGAALYGAGFATRALINLTLSAIKLIGHQQIEISFVRDEAEARAWVAGQRGQHMGEAT